MSIKEYKRKRDFNATPEPAKAGVRAGKRRLFVVQLHHASRRHYDFRLELDGTLKSWAVPKGPSFDPAVKRLAVEVEDHPVSYAGFEGDIPKGNYGAGHVDIFDHGTWEPIGNAREGLKNGELKFILHGDVLRGSWVLVRARKQGSKQQWLLIKHRDEFAGSREADDSVDAKTGRPIALAQRQKTWSTTRTTPARKTDPADDGVVITHPEREVFPGTAITKGDVAAYYRSAAARMLPEIIDRPLSVVRCPDGVGSACFFQKHAGKGWGKDVRGVRIKEKNTSGQYLCIDDQAGLLELVQMNVLEIHPWGARAGDPDHADRIVFDLDPHKTVKWPRVIAAAREVRKQLDATGLTSFVRTSGGKGLHVVVPLDPPAPWDAVRSFAQGVASVLAELHPDEFVAVAGENNRTGKIFVDWLRNGRGATSVASYSLRARAHAGVAMPLAWEELGRIKGGDAFTISNAARRFGKSAKDPWAAIGSTRQALPDMD